MIQFGNKYHIKWKLKLNDSDNESSKFHVIHNQNGTDYGEGNENRTSIKSETKGIKSSLCNYSDAYILVREI